MCSQQGVGSFAWTMAQVILLTQPEGHYNLFLFLHQLHLIYLLIHLKE